MTQFSTNNETGLVFAPLFLTDVSGKPALTTLFKATFRIVPDKPLALADEQKEISLQGQYRGDPATSSYVYEPETALKKLACDIALVGHALPPKPTQVIDVGVKVGPVQKVVRVFGDRYWVKSRGDVIASKPQPFQKMPLIYERAFGGWDRSHKDERRWTFEPRNPVGRGFGDPLRFVDEGKVPMPNIEDPSQPIKRYGDAPQPAGLGFVSPNWQPRAKLAGTYDAAWDRERKPLLPKDFDLRFFNAASPGLIAPGYLRGDEDVVVVNAAPMTPLRFTLPAVPPPVCRIALHRGEPEIIRTNLDTVIIDTDQMLVFMLWRAFSTVPHGPHDIIAVDVTSDPYQRQRARA
jgi:hypothetical protein